MSFITKRERVFNEYSLLDLPARNEGKLKAYASCTDARAWSHFCTDKSDHLVEIIKRNNETCRPKYVPTDVIVNTLMRNKNAEITRLRRKIEEFEQLLAAYDQLDLTSEQKIEIANAHAAIKAANKELDDMCLDLDLSGYTEGIDSEAFETGKSRGDEVSRHKDFELETSRGTEWSFDKLSISNKETKSNQTGGLSCPCDASTGAVDPRIDEMQDIIISKDAKLNAMRNTIAVMENDVCEPYCIYAHIYTALEKIYGILCQNEKYKQYLDLLTSGKDTRYVDIKGKIFYKLKVFEKFCCALIAPCSNDCSCYHAEIISRVETAFALSTEESVKINIDTKRAHLVADIMGNEEMKELLSKKSSCDKIDDSTTEDDFFINNNSCFDVENISRLKDLQASYEDLLTCYDDLKFEKHCLTIKCRKYEELEKDFENLRNQLNSYNSLWNEKEYYKKRSEDLDLLKEKYLVLADETLNLETQLKAQEEINNVKAVTVEQLRSENSVLEKKLNDVSAVCEKEKHALECKLKESECKMMCQDQQIKSLSLQINKLLEHSNKNICEENELDSKMLFDQIESQKEEISKLKNALFFKEEEKEQLQVGYQEKLVIINNLRLEIEDWRRTCEKQTERSNTLEILTKETQEELKKLNEENKNLIDEVETKNIAIDNLMNVVSNKSLEINKLSNEIELQVQRNKKLHEINEIYNDKINTLENERVVALNSLKLANQESDLLLTNFLIHDDPTYEQKKDTESAKTSREENEEKQQLENHTKPNSVLLKEIDTFRVNNIENIKKMLSESNESIKYSEMKCKQNKIQEIGLQEVDELKEKLKSTEKSYSHTVLENKHLVKELEEKINKIDEANRQIQVLKEEKQLFLSQLDDTEKLKECLSQLQFENNVIFEKKNNLENDLLLKNEEIKNLSNLVSKLKVGKQHFNAICSRIEILEQKTQDLNKAYDNINFEKEDMFHDIKCQRDQFLQLSESLKTKTNENDKLSNDLKLLEEQYLFAQTKINSLENENAINLNALIVENNLLKEKLESYSILEDELDALKTSYFQLKVEKENTEQDFKLHFNLLEKIKAENQELRNECNHLVEYNHDIENSLIVARDELQMQVALSSNSYIDLKREVEEMKKEKEFNLKQIKNLSDKLHESNEVINTLTQDISERDVRISILENQVNELGNEVQRLQTSLGSMIDLGEEMNFRNHEIDQSLKQMEAHHSKATHDMRIDLAKLIKENVKLEEKLSSTNVEVGMLTAEKNSYTSQEINLQDEKKKIVTNIQQLEIKCIGESALSQNNCGIKSILTSLEIIGNYVEASNNSCQLVLSKADEAKKIIEKEKQKVIKEKDDAIKDKMDIQKQLSIVREALEQQKSMDENVIKDLEAELLNQKLLIEKINQSTESYISKLREELRSMQDLYEDALSDIRDLEAKLKIANETCGQSNKIIEKTKIELEKKCQEIKSLENILHTLKSKDFTDFSAQTNIQNNLTNISLQTENVNLNEVFGNPKHQNNKKIEDVDIRKDSKHLIDMPEDYTELKSHKKQSEPLQSIQTAKFNEVQILTANIEPNIDVIKNAYLHYKIQRLGLRQTEQYSFSFISNEVTSNSDSLSASETLSPDVVKILKWPKSEINPGQSFHNIDIVTNLPSSHSLSNSFYSSENERSLTFAAPIVIVNKNKDDTNFIVNSKNDGKFLTYVNAAANKDLIKLPRWEDTGDETRIDSRLINKMASSNESEMLQNSLSVKENSITKFVAAESLVLDNNDKGRHESISNSAEYQNKILLKSTDYSLPRSISDTSFQKSFSYKDLKIEDKKQINREKRLTKNLKSRSLKSVTTELKPDDDSEDLIRISRINNEDSGNLKNKKLLVHNTMHDVPGRAIQEKNSKKSNARVKAKRNDSGHRNILNHVKSIENLKKVEIFNDNIHSIETSNQSNNISDTSSLFKYTDISKRHSTSNNLSKQSKSASSINVHGHIRANDVAVMVQIDNIDDYKEKIKFLNSTIETIDRDYKEKIRAIKAQYDNNIKNIMNDHNQGVQSLQSLHEETLQDILKVHENETDNLRSMSIEAMRKVDKLENENKILKSKILTSNSSSLDEASTRISSHEKPKGNTKHKTNCGIKTLSKTIVEEFSINPKNGPCTCSLDINLSDTIRNIFEQVDVDQRRIAEQAYLKYIANKILTSCVEALDIKELSFLHYKVCRTWKTILRKEEALHKRIDSLETELLNKQKQTQRHIAELDRKVAEERQRLQEVREAVCRDSLTESRANSSHPQKATPSLKHSIPEQDLTMARNRVAHRKSDVKETIPSGNLPPDLSCTELCCRCTTMTRERRNVLPKMDVEERHDRKQYCDERPTRLRRSNDRQNYRSQKK